MRRRLTSDDFMTGQYGRRMSGDTPDYPEQIIYRDYPFPPKVSAGIGRLARGVVDQAELMGFDINNPELMGAFVANIVGKIKKAIAQKTEKGQSAIPSVSVSIPGKGAAQLGPGGVSWVGTRPQDSGSVSVQTGVAPSSGVSDLFKNPIVIGAAIGIPLLLMMKGGKK